MTEDTSLLRDPAFRRLLKYRSRWRWGMAGGLVGTYLLYVVAGIYVPGLYARPFPGSSVPWGIAFGYLIILLSIVLSLVYVRAINRLKDFHATDRESSR